MMKYRKLIKINRLGYNERRLYLNPDYTYTVEVENYDLLRKVYFPVYSMTYGLESEALDGVNHGKTN